MLTNMKNTNVICIWNIKITIYKWAKGLKNNHLQNKQNWKNFSKKSWRTLIVYIFHDNSTGVKQHKV